MHVTTPKTLSFLDQCFTHWFPALHLRLIVLLVVRLHPVINISGYLPAYLHYPD